MAASPVCFSLSAVSRAAPLPFCLPFWPDPHLIITASSPFCHWHVATLSASVSLSFQQRCQSGKLLSILLWSFSATGSVGRSPNFALVQGGPHWNGGMGMSCVTTIICGQSIDGAINGARLEYSGGTGLLC